MKAKLRPGGQQSSDPGPVAELREVTKSFFEGGKPRAIFERFSTVIRSGKITVVRGPSGTGKTTLLNLLCGIEVPEIGTIVVQGRVLGDLRDWERSWLRRAEIGFIFQFFNLVPTLTVLENVRLPLELNGVAVRKASPIACQWLERVGLVNRLRAYPGALSGGEQQRVAIARALVHGPALVLADEPTGNLDAETARMVLELLSSLVREEGRTLVMATHSQEATGLADDVLSLGSDREARMAGAG